VNDPVPGIDAMELASRLQMSCLICLFLELRLLIREFLIRLLALLIKQKLGFYAYTNPGIQHKAGVPMGGTFILVYHEQSEPRDPAFRGRLTAALKNVNTRSGAKTASFYSGEQPLLSSIMLIDELLFLLKVNEIEEEPNEILDPVVELIQEGTVIADFYVPYLCCSDCPPSQMVFMPAQEPEPEPDNRPPVANAGPDQVIIANPNTVLTLNGSGSDPDGDPITFSWTNVSGPNAPPIINSDQPIATVTGLIEGKYEFKLTVKDDKGETGEDTVIVEVGAEIPTSKTCVPLKDIMADYKEYESKVRLLPSFREVFRSYKEVREYFKLVSGIVNETTENQIQFFAQGFGGIPIQQVIIKWLEELNVIIMEDKLHRLLALTLYRLLNKLCMYIACIQKEDIDKAKVPMKIVFDVIPGHVKIWTQLIVSGVFQAEEIAMVKGMGEDIRQEHQRIKENGETTTKPKYFKSLEVILSIIDSV
jgi:hypothetical protein